MREIANFAQETGVKHADSFHIALHYLSKSLRKVAAEAKYSPSQPRVPRGNPRGGQWTDSGGGGGRGRFGPAKILKNPLLHRIANSNGDGIPDTRPKNPMDPVGGPLSPGRGGNGGLTAAEAEIQTIRQEQLRRHLATARKIPSGVKETSLGPEYLTTGQHESLKRFKGKGKEFKNPKVINYSDGSAIYSSKVPVAARVAEGHHVWGRSYLRKIHAVNVNTPLQSAEKPLFLSF